MEKNLTNENISTLPGGIDNFFSSIKKIADTSRPCGDVLKKKKAVVAAAATNVTFFFFFGLFLSFFGLFAFLAFFWPFLAFFSKKRA